MRNWINFLYNTILAKSRFEGKAASLLDRGMTAYSVFRIPIILDADSTCNIKEELI